MDNSIVKTEEEPKISIDKDWAGILEHLVEQLDADGELPERITQATEMLLAGWPTHKVAKKLGTTSSTVRGWITKYPAMAAILATGRKLLSKWRMSKLEQQFLTAVERSQNVLDIGLDGSYFDENGSERQVDPKVLTVVAAQARYLIGLFAGQKVDIQVTHELGDTVLKAQQDALEYLALRLNQQDSSAELEPIEGIIRVIDSKFENTGPALDEKGNPPFGVMGELDRDKDGSLCHLCGRRFKSLARHLDTTHTTTTDEYELVYALPNGAVRKLDDS